jgi:hypothetical protein
MEREARVQHNELSRRDFLRSGIVGLGVGLTINFVSDNCVTVMHQKAIEKAIMGKRAAEQVASSAESKKQYQMEIDALTKEDEFDEVALQKEKRNIMRSIAVGFIGALIPNHQLER